MAIVTTREQPRFRELIGGQIFWFNSGKVDEDPLRGCWLRAEKAKDQIVNAVRLTDGKFHAFKSDDQVEYAIGARVMT